MIYVCIECGKTFDESEIAVWEESRGEFWGVPCSETMNGCPYCHGDYEEYREDEDEDEESEDGEDDDGREADQ